jgi:CubicO group peptidase (beta-lactamase class C family)
VRPNRDRSCAMVVASPLKRTLGFVLAMALMPLPSAVASGAPQSGDGPRDPREMERFLDSVLIPEMEKHHIPGAAIVFVRDGKIFFTKGYGWADLERRHPVDPDSTLFRIGSISKIFTATAVVQLADRGKIDLNTDVNSYLRRLKVPSTFPQAITAGHLLSHTAGLDEIRPGTQGPTAESVLPLAEFLRPRLIRVRPPGQTIAYSTYGITLAGELVEEVSNVGFEDYLVSNILRPLSMHRTRIIVPPELRADLAVGYEFQDGINRPQGWEWYHTTPASSITSTAADMGKFLMMLLGGGRLGGARILSERACSTMLSRHASGHPHVPGFSYGFYEDAIGELRILEHGGNMAGFSSLAVLLPEKNAGFFFVSHHEASTLRDTIKGKVLNRYYPAAPSVVPSAPSEFGSYAALYTGTYRWNTYCKTCDRSAPTVTVVVKANPDSTLTISGRRWIEVEPMLFVREDGLSKVAFRMDASGEVTHLFGGGFWVFERVR